MVRPDFWLDEKIWWNNYYMQLEIKITSIENNQTKELFKSDIKEINSYKMDSTPFKSIYYIVNKL